MQYTAICWQTCIITTINHPGGWTGVRNLKLRGSLHSHAAPLNPCASINTTQSQLLRTRDNYCTPVNHTTGTKPLPACRLERAPTFHIISSLNRVKTNQQSCQLRDWDYILMYWVWSIVFESTNTVKIRK